MLKKDKKRILIVDDNPDDIHILMESLKDYAILAATNGEKALELATASAQPDLILLDVMMPDMDGYEVCQCLKNNPATKAIDVIFISAHDTTEEKLKGYAVGGSDYLIKPVQPNELIQKVKLALHNVELRTKVETDANTAKQTAMTAMTSMGELGLVHEFMRSSFAINNIDELAVLIIEAMKQYGLESCVQIFSQDSTIYLSSQEPITPIEKELLLSCKDLGTLLERGQRFIVNYGDTSLLVKNMPENKDKRGRFRDHLAALMEAADARLQALSMHQNVSSIVKDAAQSLEAIEKIHQQQKAATSRISGDMIEQLALSFSEAGLTETQEEYLLDFVQTSMGNLLETIENSNQADEMLIDIIARLKCYST